MQKMRWAGDKNYARLARTQSKRRRMTQSVDRSGDRSISASAPSPTAGKPEPNKAISIAMLILLLRMNSLDGGVWKDDQSERPIVVHGFRATFRTWAEETGSFMRRGARLSANRHARGSARPYDGLRVVARIARVREHLALRKTERTSLHRFERVANVRPLGALLESVCNGETGTRRSRPISDTDLQRFYRKATFLAARRHQRRGKVGQLRLMWRRQALSEELRLAQLPQILGRCAR